MDEIVEPLGAEESADMAEDMKLASQVLHQQQMHLGIFPDAGTLRGDEHRRVVEAVQNLNAHWAPSLHSGLLPLEEGVVA